MKFSLCVALLAAAISGYSDIAVSNLDNSQDWEEYTYEPTGADDVAFIGNSFTTGSEAGGYLIESITLQLGEHYASGATLELYLCPDIGGAPDKINQLLLGSGNPAANVQETYTITGGYAATADTAYWIVAASDTEGFAWVATDDLSVTGESGWSIGTTAYINSDDYSIGGTPGTPTKQMFDVAIQIPEPATMGLISLFGIGTLAVKRLFT